MSEIGKVITDTRVREHEVQPLIIALEQDISLDGVAFIAHDDNQVRVVCAGAEITVRRIADGYELNKSARYSVEEYNTLIDDILTYFCSLTPSSPTSLKSWNVIKNPLSSRSLQAYSLATIDSPEFLVQLRGTISKIYMLKEQDWSRFEAERVIELYGGEPCENGYYKVEVRVLGNIPHAPLYEISSEAVGKVFYESSMVVLVGAEFARMTEDAF